MHETRRPVRVSDISTRQGVSESYLERLFRDLRLSGFLAGTRGPGGGYRLTRPLAMISVMDVIASVDNHVVSSDPGCDAERHPEDINNVADGLWCRLDDHLRNYLRTVSLASVLANAAEAENQQEHLAVGAKAHEVETVETTHSGHENRSDTPLASAVR